MEIRMDNPENMRTLRRHKKHFWGKKKIMYRKLQSIQRKMKPLYVVCMQTLLREKIKGCQYAITKFCFFKLSVSATQQHVFHSNMR